MRAVNVITVVNYANSSGLSDDLYTLENDDATSECRYEQYHSAMNSDVK